MITEPTLPIRNPKFQRPQREWRWEIAIYLYMAGMGAGSFVVGMFTNWLENPSITIQVSGFSIDIAKFVLLGGPILAAMGAPFLILDLGIRRRFLYACLNPKTSWVARGFLILSTFIILGLAILVISFFYPTVFTKRPSPWLALEILSLVFAFATAIYTGVLLKSVKYVSLWNTPLLPILFLVSALSTGTMVILLSTLGYGYLVSRGEWFYKMINLWVCFGQILILIECFVLALYFMVYRKDDRETNQAYHFVSREIGWLICGGIALFLYAYFLRHPILLIAAGLFLFIGGFSLRLQVLAQGVKEQPPMVRWIEMRTNIKAFGKG
jgi:formate-dependent nitrite reductase membrane component NrfD